jgi:hypothetical protein
LGILYVFEHGLRHSPPGDPPLLRVSIESGGKLTLEDVDEHEEISQRGTSMLLPEDLASIRSMLDSEKLKLLGLSLGHGPAWGRVLYGANLRSSIVIHHSSAPGVLLAESVRGVAKAALPMLTTLLSLFSHVAQTADEPTQRKGLQIPKDERPIRMSGKHGNLLVRYSESPDNGHWIKLYDSGVVEHREHASEESDGKPIGEVQRLSTGLVAELHELVRRHLPKEVEASVTSRATWEVYDANGKRDIRKVALDGKGTFVSPAQRAAVKDALKQFTAIYNAKH